jgi:glycoside/pentoside/hexuronide:cation symporter, GPH family
MTSGSQSKRAVSYPLYTLGDLASGIYSVTPSILLMFYMTNVLGAPVALATLAAVVPKVVDLLSNPVIGTLSDRFRSRWGRRRPFILFAALTIMPTFALIWASPFAAPAASAWFVLVTFSLCTLCFGCFVIPFYALSTEIATDYHDRTSLNSIRAVYAMIGCLVAGAGAPFIVAQFGGGRHGYVVLGLVMGAIMAAAVFVTFLSAREPRRAATEATPSLRQTIAALAGARPFFILWVAYFVHIVASGLSGAALAYFVTYVLGRDTNFISLLFLLNFGATILAIPLWTLMGRRIGKFGTFTVALLFQASCGAGYFALDGGTPVALIAVVAIAAGMAEGGIQVFAFSMLADCIQHQSAREDAVPAEALFSGLFIAGEKMGFAVGALLGGLVFGASGLIVTTQGAVSQPGSAIFGVRMAMSLIPAALNVAAVAVFFLYRTFEREVAQREKQLA